MKKIELTQGQFAVVDDEDYEYLNSFNWYAIKGRQTFYACRNVHVGVRKQKRIWMHQDVSQSAPGIKLDHRDGNGLNNCKENIRGATDRENCQNRKKQRGFYTSKFKGVTWRKTYKKWISRIRVEGRLLYLGAFDAEDLAAKIYDTAALQYFGRFAKLNFSIGYGAGF